MASPDMTANKPSGLALGFDVHTALTQAVNDILNSHGAIHPVPVAITRKRLGLRVVFDVDGGVRSIDYENQSAVAAVVTRPVLGVPDAIVRQQRCVFLKCVS